MPANRTGKQAGRPELVGCPPFGRTPGAPWRQRLLGALAGWLLVVYAWTIRMRREGEEPARALQAAGARLLFCFWHGRQALCAPKLPWVRAAIMVSRSADGEILTRALDRFGHRLVRGSSGAGGSQALQGMAEAMAAGYDAGLSVDGSRGPAGQCKVGAVVLAQRTGAYLVPLATSSRRAWVFRRSWDRFMLPLPFAGGALVMGEPLAVPPDAAPDEIERIRQRLEAAIETATIRADQIVGRSS